tara:strand:- start:3 stop:188 length:186 start_codon:yes stop_codon:yes gene_type:complete
MGYENKFYVFDHKTYNYPAKINLYQRNLSILDVSMDDYYEKEIIGYPVSVNTMSLKEVAGQ